MSELFGHVDGLIGLQVHGWAFEDADSNCLIEIIDGNGEVLGRGRCGRQRADLAVMSYGRTDLGFLVAIDRYGDTDALHVHANGKELPGSPIAIGAHLFDGFFEINGMNAEGWIQPRADTTEDYPIELTLPNGRVVGRTRAKAERTTDERKPFAPFRFRTLLDKSCLGLEEFAVTARTPHGPFATATARLPLDGYIDHIDSHTVSGWLVAPTAPGVQLTLTAWRGGKRVGLAQCKQPRPDLKSKYPGSWQSGFSIELRSDDRRSTELQELSLRLEDTDRDLLGSPFLVGHRSKIVAMAKQLSNSINRQPEALTPPEQALFQDMLSQYIAQRRHGSDHVRIAYQTGPVARPPITVLVPVYKGVEITETCLRSVLGQLRTGDQLLVIADRPPEPEMTLMLRRFRAGDPITILVNEENLGFVGSVNRGLAYVDEGDVLLLNSDTRFFAGGLDELRAILASAEDIATVTAISNNATIFSYPHPRMPRTALDDITLAEAAEIALRENAGRSVDVPTGHGFCMLVRREVLSRIGRLNETFGRGYGEENEFCLRAADLGYRHVAAIGALVEHRESVSFGDDDRLALLSVNLPQLEAMYPEYTPTIMAFESTDPLRVGRWALDAFRLRRARAQGQRFILTVANSLTGGTAKAAGDISKLVGYKGRTELRLIVRPGATMWLDSPDPEVRAVFARGEVAELITLLDEAQIELAVFHQVLGLDATTIEALSIWAGKRRSVFYAHDFYSICPRVTLINAVDRFCDVADTSVCARCVGIRGSHESSQLEDLSPAEHRALFQSLFAKMTAIVAPSTDSVRYLERVFDHDRLLAIPHPLPASEFATQPRQGDPNQIVLFGAIGPHKGSDALLEIANKARLASPQLHFTVIGYTNMDHAFAALDNVTITGPYVADDLPAIVERVNPCAALFLHGWPETYSYTLTEVASFGLIPVVPDIGAPAERVRKSGFGLVFSYPIDTSEVVDLLSRIDDLGPRITARPPDIRTTGTEAIIDALFNAAEPGAPASRPEPTQDRATPATEADTDTPAADLNIVAIDDVSAASVQDRGINGKIRVTDRRRASRS